MRVIKSIEAKYLVSALDLVEAVYTAHESVGLPTPECLMVKELISGSLEGIQGQVSYRDYDCLR